MFAMKQPLVYYPILDIDKPKAQALQKAIESGLYDNLITHDKHQANVYLVAGGDGFMLDTIKKYYDFDKPPQDNKIFFGINCGTLGFLLQDISLDELPKYMQDIDSLHAHLLKVNIRTTDNAFLTKYALNDIVIGGNILDYYKFFVDSPHLQKKFHGTGIMISTALGSSAYWLNNGGPLMPLESRLRGISGLASLPFGHHIIKPETLHVSISGRSPVMVGIDGYAGKIDNVQDLTIEPTQDYITLGFTKTTAFDTKRMLLSEQKLLRDDF